MKCHVCGARPSEEGVCVEPLPHHAAALVLAAPPVGQGLRRHAALHQPLPAAGKSYVYMGMLLYFCIEMCYCFILCNLWHPYLCKLPPPVPHQPPLSLEPAASLGASPQPLAVRGCAGLDAGHHGVAVRLSSAQYRVALSNTQQLRHLLCPERDLAAEHVVVRLLQVGDAAHLQQPAQCAR